MQLFYTYYIYGEMANFDEAEAKHAVQVLRKKIGDPLTFVDGDGGWYEGEIVEAGKKKMTAKILREKKMPPLPKVPIHLVVAPTKNMERFEWLLEKATEVGISAITPIICERSERRRIRPERLEKILRSAMKQSLKAQLPHLNELTGFQDFIKNNATHDGTQRFIAHCQKGSLPLLKNNCQPGQGVILLVGPEGDFSDHEIGLATQNGFSEISLGKSRLRTETAGLAAVFAVNFLNE